jgi:ribosome-binding ATPase YchF (GTP1/OBG family)
LKRVDAHLKVGKMARELALDEKELPVVKQLNLLTMKPMMFALNVSQATENKRDITSKIPGMFVEIDPVFETGLDDLIKKSYELLNLITYFTTGEDETRAWTIQRGSTAPTAGMAIHTDFRDKFIRAEVVASADLLSVGSYATAREKGMVRTEGKEYVVKDGDVIEFRI